MNTLRGFSISEEKIELEKTFVWPTRYKKNHRMGEVGRNLWRSVSPKSLLGEQKQTAQGSIQLGFEHLLRWKLHSLSGQLVPVCDHPRGKKKIKKKNLCLMEFPVFQFVAIGPCPFPGWYQEEPGSLSTSSKSLMKWSFKWSWPQCVNPWCTPPGTGLQLAFVLLIQSLWGQ